MRQDRLSRGPETTWRIKSLFRQATTWQVGVAFSRLFGLISPTMAGLLNESKGADPLPERQRGTERLQQAAEIQHGVVLPTLRQVAKRLLAVLLGDVTGSEDVQLQGAWCGGAQSKPQ